MEWDEEELTRMPLKVLGRHIGTFTGWDVADTASLIFYDFEPLEGVCLPVAECITIELESGKALYFTIDNEENYIENSLDIVSAIAHLPLVKDV